MLSELTSSQKSIDLENKYGAHNYHPLEVVLSKGRGVYGTSKGENILIFYQLIPL